MKKLLAWILSISMVIVLTACGGGSGSNTTTATTASGGGDTKATEPAPSGETYELIFQNHDPESAAETVAFKKWVEEVKEASGGRLIITLYNGGSLGAGTESYDMIINRTADIAWVTTAMYGSRFPITEGFALPMLGIEDTYHAGRILNDLWEQGLFYSDFEGVKVMSVFSTATGCVGLAKPGGLQPEDFVGKKLRASSGYITNFVEGIGATPMTVPSPEQYDALSKGVIEGNFCDWLAIYAANLLELLDHVIDYNVYISPNAIIMNEESYNSLPEDLQKLLDEKLGTYMTEIMAEAWGSNRELTYKQAEEMNVPIVELPQETIDAWSAVAQDVHKLWIKNLDDLGYDGQAIYDALLESIEKNR